jgi:hypothetical protein
LDPFDAVLVIPFPVEKREAIVDRSNAASESRLGRDSWIAPPVVHVGVKSDAPQPNYMSMRWVRAEEMEMDGPTQLSVYVQQYTPDAAMQSSRVPGDVLEIAPGCCAALNSLMSVGIVERAVRQDPVDPEGVVTDPIGEINGVIDSDGAIAKPGPCFAVPGAVGLEMWVEREARDFQRRLGCAAYSRPRVQARQSGA